LERFARNARWLRSYSEEEEEEEEEGGLEQG
jgi:hypothetical protein